MGRAERQTRRQRATDVVAQRRLASAGRFKALARQAIAGLPPELRGRINNVAIMVRERPTTAELRSAGVGPGGALLGLYQGTPLPARNSAYHLTLPDRIFLYRQPLEAMCRTDEELVAQIRRTVLHELAHHFGIDDDRLHRIGAS
ncbi:MAG: metallopeptidase family protein [Dehalococcoidia bacterium]